VILKNPTSEDAAHYTSLPVLMTVPELLMPEEARSVLHRRKAASGHRIAAIIVGIPALALILKLTAGV